MKIHISFSAEDNLVTLRNPVPNFDFQYFAGNPINHPSEFRRLNDQPKKNAKRRKRKRKKGVEQQDRPENQPGGIVHPQHVTEVEREQTIYDKVR